ncbi:hypothetical protein [Ruegeria aquimaris]|uniref:Tetratricopeptide repeat protein n=1 Tax=Ruegeria aquimaris TaxID=2984333 RepID=A0ABT3AFN9_9RHOB|nr:hypothetical protein [Ruegeria sp. XHP0148]MCV2887489.1 hypothetical protein [Ruegeria sp. XHP0148]
MLKLWVVVFLSLFAVSARAAEIEVRSGEHDGFTRLVFRIEPGTDWNLESGADAARLTIDIPELVYRFDTVFDRIPHTRLAALNQTAPGAPLELKLACPCDARGFVQSGSMLVIDIRPRPEGAPVPPALPPVARPVTLPLVPDRIARPSSSDSAAAAETDRALPPVFSALPVRQADRAVETRLLSRILRGVDQEVLTLDPSGATGATPDTLAAQAALAETLEQGLGLSNLRISTVVDRDLGGARDGIASPVQHRPCTEAARLAIESWGDETPFQTQLARLRARLYLEFDAVDTDIALQLTRLYLHFGFGAEARDVLPLAGVEPRDQLLLTALADAVDGVPPRADNPLARQQACDGPAALWSALTEGRVAENADTKAMLRSFATLPQHLRAHLGPTLGGHLTEAGFVDAARQVLRATERTRTADPVSVEVVEAKLAGLENKPDVQEEKLSRIVTDDKASVHAPLALADLIEKRWAEGGDVSERDVELAAAFAQEYRKSDLGPRLAAAHVIALALAGRFDQAMEAVGTTGTDGDRNARGDTLNRVLSRLTARSDDLTFLRHISLLPNDQFLATEPENAERIAERLTALGFHELALRYADRPQDRKGRHDRAVLIARATLGTGRPHRALLELAGIEGEEANLIRAEALYQTGDYSGAADLLAQSGDLERASRYVWISGASDPMPGTEGTGFGEIHAMGMDLLNAGTEYPETPLAQARSIVEDSSAMRDRIKEMLGRLE